MLLVDGPPPGLYNSKNVATSPRGLVMSPPPRNGECVMDEEMRVVRDDGSTAVFLVSSSRSTQSGTDLGDKGTSSS